jgi:hypothetical protein
MDGELARSENPVSLTPATAGSEIAVGVSPVPDMIGKLAKVTINITT